MNENIDNLLLEHLKALSNDVRDLRAKMEEEFQDVKLRLTSSPKICTIDMYYHLGISCR